MDKKKHIIQHLEINYSYMLKKKKKKTLIYFSFKLAFKYAGPANRN